MLIFKKAGTLHESFNESQWKLVGNLSVYGEINEKDLYFYKISQDIAFIKLGFFIISI